MDYQIVKRDNTYTVISIAKSGVVLNRTNFTSLKEAEEYISELKEQFGDK